MQKSIPHLLAHNDAIAGYTSQSLGLPAYVCKTDSSTAIKLGPRMHQNCHFKLKNQKKISAGGGITPPQTPPPVRKGTPLPHLITALGASFLALAMIRPHTFETVDTPLRRG